MLRTVRVGVHVALLSKQAAMSADAVAAVATGHVEATCWSDQEQLLLRVCEQLHRSATIDDELWTELVVAYSENSLLEIIMLVGFYQTVSFLANSLRLIPEPCAGVFRFDQLLDGLDG